MCIRDRIRIFLRQRQKVAGTVRILVKLVQLCLLGCKQLFQLGGGQLAQGFFLVPEAGIFTLDMPCLLYTSRCV